PQEVDTLHHRLDDYQVLFRLLPPFHHRIIDCTPQHSIQDLHFEVLPAYLLHFQHHLRSEEHTSELQSRFDLVCRLLLEKNNLIGKGVDEWQVTEHHAGEDAARTRRRTT